MERIAATRLWSEYHNTAAVRRAEEYAKYTSPALMVDTLEYQGPVNSTQTVEYDFQSAGALLLNSLASKLTQSLFPPNRASFQIVASPELQKVSTEAGVDDATLRSRMAQLERDSSQRLFMNAGYHKLNRAIKLLAATGNALLYRDPDTAKMTLWSMQNYAVRRSPNGDIDCMVLRQRFKMRELPAEVLADAMAKRVGGNNPDSTVEFYTVAKWESTNEKNRRRVRIHYQIDDKRVGPESSYPEHLCPFIVMVWSLADGEHMGRGLVEEYAGDFARLSLVSEQLGLYELDSLNVLNLVDESAGAAVDDYKDADTGDYVPGRANAVTSYERGDYNKIAAVNSSLAGIISRLSRAFMYTGDVRDAERVTAEEIRRTAVEADTLLGGVYSLLSETVQTPLAYLCMWEASASSDNLILGMLSRAYRPTILTGIPALTRASESQNLLEAVQEAAAVVPVLGQLSNRFDTEKVIELIFNNKSVDLAAISKSPEQIALEAEQKAAVANAQLDVAQGALAATESLPGVLGNV